MISAKLYFYKAVGTVSKVNHGITLKSAFVTIVIDSTVKSICKNSEVSDA